MEQNHHLATINDIVFSDPEKYQWLVGRLIYLKITRPESCYSIHILVQFMGDPLRLLEFLVE
uniref:Retrovirus-related Pol polyprotein from transposon TNT 1-94 n=1 Tax=Cajanus cajan TaxID=3821 RepID=A0A151SBY0_CAJCA|nr:hypothetical protein KK1_025853 [Cajanus cajan]